MGHDFLRRRLVAHTSITETVGLRWLRLTREDRSPLRPPDAFVPRRRPVTKAREVVAAPEDATGSDGVQARIGERPGNPLPLEPGEHVPQPAAAHAALARPCGELAPGSRHAEEDEQRTAPPGPPAIRAGRLRFSRGPRLSWIVH